MEVKIIVGILVLVGILQGTLRHHHRKPSGALANMSSVEKFIRQSHPPLNEAEIELLVASIQEASQKEGLDPALLTALLFRESRFNPKAVSSSGAKGLGQLLDATAKEVGVENPFDIRQNVLGTARYLSLQIARFPGDAQAIDRGLACYRIGCRPVLESGSIPQVPAVLTFIHDIHAIEEKIRAL